MENQINNRLKPCPFCGSKPECKAEADKIPPFSMRAWIRCPQCRQSQVCSDWYDGDMGTTEASWNKRTDLSNKHTNEIKISPDHYNGHPKSDYEQTDEKGRPLTYWGGLATQNSYPTVCVVCGHALESPISGCACIHPTTKTPPNDKP